MAFTLSTIAAKDSAGTAIGGGLLAADKAGGGVGPFIMAHLIADGVAGTNLAKVDASNRVSMSLDNIAATLTLATITTLGTITNVVHVDDNSGALTVDNAGTFAVQAAQSGTWTVQPGNTANTTAWKVDGSAVTQPVSLASVPSHAVTNAGTFAAQAAQSGTWTVQPGNTANTTAWKVDGSAVTQPVSGTLTAVTTVTTLTGTTTLTPGTAATNLGKAIDTVAGATDTGVAVLAIRDDALTTLTPADGDWAPRRVNARGAAWTCLEDGSGGQVTMPTLGQQVAASSVPSVQAGFPYEVVAASQTAQVMGGSGAAGDYLSHVVVSPVTAGCGVVTILDNATEVAKFGGGGTTALPTLAPIIIPIGGLSTSGAWKITTGANVTATAFGRFA